MAVESHDKKLSELLTWVGQGKAQLPEFQRNLGLGRHQDMQTH